MFWLFLRMLLCFVVMLAEFYRILVNLERNYFIVHFSFILTRWLKRKIARLSNRVVHC